jgi:LPXTG-motif cell wall-anchored protein
MNLKSKFLSAGIAIALVAMPTVAMAAGTSLSVEKNGSTVTAIQSGDTIDVTTTGSIDAAGSISKILASVWSKESLALTNLESIILPEGWTLEFTTDSETWDATVPTDLTTVTGIRAVGEVLSNGKNTFETTATSQVVATQANFQGASGGDGFSVTFGGDRVYNVFHHDSKLRIDCHIKGTGASCYGDVSTFEGYKTGRYSEAYWDSARQSLWVQTYQVSSAKSGMTCVNYSDKANPVLCETEFVPLQTSRGMYDMETSTKIGTKVYVINQNNWNLLCFDIKTAAACPNNGFQLPNSGLAENDYYWGRVSSPGDGKVYWTTWNKMGCYNPATNDLCGTAINISSESAQFPMFPVRNAAGVLQGMCLFHTKQCINSSGASVSVLPASLSSWMSDHAIPEWNNSDAGLYAEQNNKLYLPVGPSESAGDDVYCFDFTTSAACAGFSGVGVGAEIYAIVSDPALPNCLWTNGNKGQITTFNGVTGLAGCALDYPVIEMPYDAVAPRMACSEDNRVLSWDSIAFNLPEGLTASQLKVTILDSDGFPIEGWTDVVPNAQGVINMKSVSVDTTGTKPTIRVNAGSVAEALLAQVSADVKFKAEDPQLCFKLAVAPNCPDFTPASGDLSVPDGLIQSAAISTNADGKTISAGDREATLTGTSTDGVCPATIAKMLLPKVEPTELANTGADTGVITLVVLALMMLVGGSVLVTRANN